MEGKPFTVEIYRFQIAIGDTTIELKGVAIERNQISVTMSGFPTVLHEFTTLRDECRVRWSWPTMAIE